MIIIYAVIVLVGFVPFVISLFKLRRLKKLQRESIKTNATVKEIYGRQLKGMNRISIEFWLHNGGLFSQEIIVGGVPGNVGDKIPLITKKAIPQKIF